MLYQDWDRLTIEAQGDFIVLPHWGDDPVDNTQSHYSETEKTSPFHILVRFGDRTGSSTHEFVKSLLSTRPRIEPLTRYNGHAFERNELNFELYIVCMRRTFCLVRELFTNNLLGSGLLCI